MKLVAFKYLIFQLHAFILPMKQSHTELPFIHPKVPMKMYMYVSEN